MRSKITADELAMVIAAVMAYLIAKKSTGDESEVRMAEEIASMIDSMLS